MPKASNKPPVPDTLLGYKSGFSSVSKSSETIESSKFSFMKSILSSLVVLAASLNSISAQIAVGGECGGSKYQGSLLCEDGAYCALITDDYQCLKLEDIYAKPSISFILTTLPTFTFATVRPTIGTIGTVTIPTRTPTSTPCPTVTKTLTVTFTQSCSSTSPTTTTTTTISTTTTTRTTPTPTTQTTQTTQTTTTTKPPTTTTTTTTTTKPPTTTTTATSTTTTLPCQSLQPEAPAGKNFTYKGVNIAGFEFGCQDDGSCKPPNSPPLTSKADGCGQMKWFYSRGMNTFRLPIGWQYATPTLGGPFDPTMWGSYDKLVQCCLALPGAYCVVDIHNWARWNTDVIGQTMSDSPYIKLWQMIASYYASEPRVIFGLMNEPYKLSISAWGATLQRVVNAIRPIAPRHVILLPGIEYAHADTFISSGTATVLDAITNPDGSKNNLLFDLHQWLDRGNLGTSSVCVTNNVAVFTPVVNWLRCNKRKAFLSATGGGNAASDNCLTLMCQQMSYLFSNSDVIVGYTGWAAGSYDTSYIYDETPTWLGSPWSDTPLDFGSCINDLPDEILAAILSLTIGDWSPRYDICLVELTCRRWRALAECTPTFWTNVTASEGIDYVRQALIKSKDVSIDLLYDSWRSNVEFSQFMMEVDPHIQRWRSLTVYEAVAPSDLGRLRTTVAPRLETLHLCQTCNIPFFGDQLILFGGDASPTLRDVWIEGFPIQVNPSILQNLTSLTLKDIENVTLSSIMTILGASPCLKSLELANISPLGPPQTNHDPIQLNELQGIALHHLDPSATSFFLYAIRAPGCSSLIVNYALDVGSSIQTFLTPNLSHLHSAMQHMAKLAKYIEILRHNPEHHVIAVGDFRLGLETQENQLKEAFLWLIHALGL
ncbi:hypothetical protein FRC04_003626 [Tulasnella sp. 424]|nr:hypothetical protein FRC04_003626 [Tulasnella sp. 424]